MKIRDKLAKRTRYAPDDIERHERLDELTKDLVDVLNLASGVWSSEHTLPKHIKDAAKATIDRGPEYRFFGLPELKRAIAEKLEKENGVEVDPETQVIVTTGGYEAIYLAIFAFVDAQDEVTMGDPGYLSGYEPNVLMAGGRVVHVPVREERNFRLDPEDLEKRLTKNTKMISIISPENPTGAVMRKEDLEVIAEIAKRRDLIVLSNEIYEKLIYDGQRNYSIATFPGMEDRTLTLNGFSKGYNMHGYRVGYLAGPKEAIRRMSNLQAHLTISVNDVGQHAALAALTGPQNWIAEAVKEYEKRRNLLVEGLNSIDGIRCQKPDGSMYAFPNIKEFGMSSFEFMKYLLKEARVWVHPGTPVFGINGEGYLRVAFTRPRKIIQEALERIRTALEKL